MTPASASAIFSTTFEKLSNCAAAQNSANSIQRRAAKKGWVMTMIEHLANSGASPEFLEPGWSLLLDLEDIDVGVTPADLRSATPKKGTSTGKRMAEAAISAAVDAPALGYYHPKRDETRNIDLGPEHDWSSHAADAFGLMAISYEEPSKTSNFNRVIEYPRSSVA